MPALAPTLPRQLLLFLTALSLGRAQGTANGDGSHQHRRLSSSRLGEHFAAALRQSKRGGGRSNGNASSLQRRVSPVPAHAAGALLHLKTYVRRELCCLLSIIHHPLLSVHPPLERSLFFDAEPSDADLAAMLDEELAAAAAAEESEDDNEDEEGGSEGEREARRSLRAVKIPYTLCASQRAAREARAAMAPFLADNNEDEEEEKEAEGKGNTGLRAAVTYASRVFDVACWGISLRPKDADRLAADDVSDRHADTHSRIAHPLAQFNPLTHPHSTHSLHWPFYIT